jgi:hypothetical protein
MAKFFYQVLDPKLWNYSQSEIKKNKIVYSQRQYYTLIRAIKAHFDHIVEKRINSIKKRFLNQTDPISMTVSALFDANFRKQKRFGPSEEEVRSKVYLAYKKRKPITLVGLMFTRKNTCTLKTGSFCEASLDLAEIISFFNLNAWCQLINHFYPFGCNYYILSEGKRFTDAFDLCLPLVRLYQKKLKDLVSNYNLSHIFIEDFEDFLERNLPSNLKISREYFYQKAIEIYKNKVNLDLHNFDQSIKNIIINDPIKDDRNRENNFIPLWRSIIHSIPYFPLRQLANSFGVEYEFLYKDVFMVIFTGKKSKYPIKDEIKEYILLRSFDKAILHNSRVLADNMTKIFVEKLIDETAFRTSINPKPGDHLGIYAIRETASRVQPWHGKVMIYKSGNKIRYTCLTRLEIEGEHNAIPVYVGQGKIPVFYLDKVIVNSLEDISYHNLLLDFSNQ